jgi:hypothetical protein
MASKSKNKLADMAMPSPVDDMKWRAKDALNTLTRAEEIKRDKGLMKHVKCEARNQAKALSKVCSPKKASGR